MRSCRDKKRKYNGKSKTKEDESTLVNTIDNLFNLASSCHQNEDIALSHLTIKMKNMHVYEPFEEWSGVVEMKL